MKEILFINPSCRLNLSDEGLIISVSGCESICLSGDYSLILKFLLLIDGSLSFKDVDNILSTLPEYDFSEVREMYRFFIKENIIKIRNNNLHTSITEKERMKYDRQIKNFLTLPNVTEDMALTYQEKLSNSNILILGVGGVGSYIAQTCAMIGIKNISLIDFDNIEISNTSRQILYNENDIGCKKIEVAKSALLTINPDINVNLYESNIKKSYDLVEIITHCEKNNGLKIDLLFTTADTPRGEIQYIVDDACHTTGTPFLKCGIFGFHNIHIGPLIIPNQTKSYTSVLPPTKTSTNIDIQTINNRFEPSVMDPFNAVAGKLSVVEAIKFLTGYSVSKIIGKSITLNLADWSIEDYDYL